MTHALSKISSNSSSLYRLEVSISQQILSVFELNDKTRHGEASGKAFKTYSVSTALNGVGSEKNSGKTPLGKHQVRAMIGAGAPINSVFVARRTTGEIYDSELAANNPNRDWILTRIIWLSGLEKGKNRLGNVDTMQRYIYIHGTPDTEPMGQALSHGCIRMRNSDIIELFDLISAHTLVEIVA